MKLVRDKIPDIIHEHGELCVTRVAGDNEYCALLRAKLQEEVTEFLRDENAQELADILEVIHAIAAVRYCGYEQIEQMRITKRAQKGGFEQRIVLEKVQT